MSWRCTEDDKIGFALYNFPAGDGPHRLALSFGDVVDIWEESEGWYRGCLRFNPKRTGIFPTSHIHLKEHTVVSKSDGSRVDTVALKGDPLCNEAGEYLREYGKHLQRLYTDSSSKFDAVYKLMNDVIEYRQTLLSGKIPSDNLQSLRGKLTLCLDLLNDKLNLSTVPRNELGDPVEPDQCSYLSLYRTHQFATEDLQTAEDSLSTFGGGRRTSVTPPSSRGAAPANQSHHLYLSIDSVNHTFNEDCELYFSLYDKDLKMFLTERVCMLVSKNHGNAGGGVPRKSALFVELGNRDLFLRTPYLVCHVVRRSGQMLFENKKYQSSHVFRRPYACGVLDPGSVLKPFAQNETNDEERSPEEFIMPLSVIAKDNSMDFLTFQEQTIKKMASKGNTWTDKSGFTLHVTLQLFRGDLQQVRNDSPKLGFVTLVQRLGFPEIILPGDVRNDIYITVERGEYERGQKSAERNVEVSMTVCNEDGSVIENGLCIAAGLPAVSEYQSFIFYHNNSPKWGEVLKLNLTFDQLQRAHVRLAFRHLAKNEKSDKADKTFSFAFVKIMSSDGSIVQDGSHELVVYKADSKKWKNAQAYLTAPFMKATMQATMSGNLGSSGSALSSSGSSGQVTRSNREAIWISTLCCSTKMTQKIELLSLLKWKLEPAKLKTTLDNLTLVPGNEIFKFLQDTLDCLFQILTENADKYRTQVFHVLIYILGFLYQGTFQHFRPVLDLYVSKLFSASRAFGALMESLNEQLRSWDKEASANELCKVFEVIDPLFGFIAQSHKLYLKQKASEGTLSVNVHNFFVSLLPIMRAVADQNTSLGRAMLNLQSAILLNIPSVLSALHSVMERNNITSHIGELLGSVSLSQQALFHPRLTFLKNLLESPVKLIGYQNTRDILLPKVVHQLEDFMQNRMSQLPPTSDTTLLCVYTVGLLLEALQNSTEPPGRSDVKHVLRLLQPIMTICVVLDRKLPVAVGNWVNFLGVLHLCSPEDFSSYCETFGGKEQLAQFIKDVFDLSRRAVREPFFQEKWLFMHLVQNNILLKVIRSSCSIMRDSFLDLQSYDEELFQELIIVCADFACQPPLQMENRSQLVQARLLNRFGDLRLEIGAVLAKMWCSLGNEHKEGFIVSSMDHILRMSLVRMSELRRITIPLIWDLVEVDNVTLGTIKRVEARLLEKLDDLLTLGKGDEDYKEQFSQITTRKCNEASDSLAAQGSVLVAHVTRLIELSLDYRNVPSDDYNKDKRMGCMYNLLNFYREIERQELYVRYVYKLCELHRRDEKYTEAALTLLLHGDRLKWIDSPVDAEGKYPRHSEKARKEQLFKEAIQLFDLGKGWELGIRLCKELAAVYEETLFDYHKLGAILETQAQFFRKIVTELRVDPEYFRVGYYGKEFPHFLRNKAFIHRGLPYEKLSAIKLRLSYEFPIAEFLTYTTAAPDSIHDSPGQHLQLFRVNPIPEVRAIFEGKDVDDKIISHYNCNDVKTFKYDRPFHKGEKDKSNEFASLWIERSTMITRSPFPGVLSYFPINSEVKVEINPLELALESVENKNREILALTNACQASVTFHLQSLTMVLNGVIDAAVNGGTANYRKVFFAEAYLKTNPDHDEMVKKMERLLENQCNLLGRSLEIHGKRVGPTEEGLHQHMTETYTKMRYIVFPLEAPPPESPKKAPSFGGGAHRSMTMKGRELPPTPVQIKEPLANRGNSSTISNKPRRAPSAKVPKGNMIQPFYRPKPPPMAAPPPPREATPTKKPPSMYVDPYEVVEIDEKMGGPGGLEDGDDYEEPDDLEAIRQTNMGSRRSTGGSGSVNRTSVSSHHDEIFASADDLELSRAAAVLAQGKDGGSGVESFYSTAIDDTYDSVDFVVIDSGGGGGTPTTTTTPGGGRPLLQPPPPSSSVERQSSSPTPSSSDDKNLYGFDRLDDKNLYGFDRLDDQPGLPPGKPLSPQKPSPFVKGASPSGSTGSTTAGTAAESVYGFDRLDNMPVGPPPSLPPRPQKSTPPSDGQAEPETPPKIPQKKRKTVRKQHTISESSLTADDPLQSPSIHNGTPPSFSPLATTTAASVVPPPEGGGQARQNAPQPQPQPQPQPRPRSMADSPPVPRPRQGSAATKQSLGLSDAPPPSLPPKPTSVSSLPGSSSSSIGASKSPEKKAADPPPPLPQKPVRQPSMTAESRPQLPGKPLKTEAPPTQTNQGKGVSALLAAFQKK